MEDYYRQFIGSTIQDFSLVEEDGVEPFPCFTLVQKDGSSLKVEVSRDPEGNGGGFLFIGPGEEGAS